MALAFICGLLIRVCTVFPSEVWEKRCTLRVNFLHSWQERGCTEIHRGSVEVHREKAKIVFITLCISGQPPCRRFVVKPFGLFS